MKNHLLCTLLAFGQLLPLFAQTEYAVSNIPENLLKNADLVFRKNDLTFEITSPGTAIETEHVVITLLNERAVDYNDQVFWYDQIRKIEDIEGTVYDATGKQVRKIKKKDISDQKPLEQFVTDTRVKSVNFPRLPFPYTIEYKVVTKHLGLMHYPVFQPQRAARQAVESATFQILAPPEIKVRFKEKNVLPDQKKGPFKWHFEHLSALVSELYVPLGFESWPSIMTAPTQFSIEGFEGDMSSWQSFGQFMQKLNAGKTELPAETRAKLLEMTKDCPDTLCKVRRVYEFLQNSTRYYFVGLGIGGWQPMSAEEVNRFKYSDCKGLSNYTVAMLNALGLPAYYALIQAKAAEQRSLESDFPNPYFNHATICVPTQSDTLWLECTSQQESFGFLSDFTDDRPALVIFPEGGKLVQTPRYDETVNTVQLNNQLTLQADGSAILQSVGVYQGLQQVELAYLSETDVEMRNKYFYNYLKLGDFVLKSLELKRKNDRIPQVEQTLSLELPQMASVSGKRLFLPLKFLTKKYEPSTAQAPRKFPVQAISRGITEEETTVISIPAGYTLENPFAPIVLKSEFGTFELTLSQNSGEITLHRKFVLNNSIHPKEQFESLQNFLKSVLKADQTKLVLVH